MAVTKCSPGRARAEVFILLPHLRGPKKGDRWLPRCGLHPTCPLTSRRTCGPCEGWRGGCRWGGRAQGRARCHLPLICPLLFRKGTCCVLLLEWYLQGRAGPVGFPCVGTPEDLSPCPSGLLLASANLSASAASADGETLSDFGHRERLATVVQI